MSLAAASVTPSGGGAAKPTPGKPPAAPKDPKKGGKDAVALPERSFSQVQWDIAAPDLSLQALGWSPESIAELAAMQQPAAVAVPDPPTSKPPAGKAKPAAAPAAGKPPPGKGGKAPGPAAARALPQVSVLIS